MIIGCRYQCFLKLNKYKDKTGYMFKCNYYISNNYIYVIFIFARAFQNKKNLTEVQVVAMGWFKVTYKLCSAVRTDVPDVQFY